MKRRDFVKGLTAAQLALMTQSPRLLGANDARFFTTGARTTVDAPSSSIKRLNVVVHGMFVIVIDKNGKLVYLKAPQVGGQCPHTYRAQAFLPDDNDPDNVVPAPSWGDGYEVTTPKTDIVDFTRSSDSSISVETGEKERLAIYIGKKNQKTPPYWTVVLPLPDDLWPLREAPYNYFDSSTFTTNGYNATYINNGMKWEQMPPMVYVLSYSKVASSKIIFKGNNQEVPIGDDGFARLHFYAEPKDNCADHVHTALSALDDMFDSKLTLQFDPTLADPDQPLGRDPKIPEGLEGVRLAEERSLSELVKYLDSRAFRKGVPLIAEQYPKLLAYRETFLKTRDDRALAALTPGDLKPPSNCMSLIGTTS